MTQNTDYRLMLRASVTEDDKMLFECVTVNTQPLTEAENVFVEQMQAQIQHQVHDFTEGFRWACSILQTEPPKACFLAHALITHLRGYLGPDNTWAFLDASYDTEMPEDEIARTLTYSVLIRTLQLPV